MLYFDYNFRPLLYMNLDKIKMTSERPKDKIKYISWIKKYGKGRVFYSSHQREPVPTRIGHRVYFTPDALDQFVSDKTEWFKDGRS